jgi:hypothetical protein
MYGLTEEKISILKQLAGTESSAEIMEKLGISYVNLTLYCKRCGISLKTSGGRRIYKTYRKDVKKKPHKEIVKCPIIPMDTSYKQIAMGKRNFDIDTYFKNAII